MNKNTIKDLMFTQIRYGLIDTETNQIKLQLTARLLLMGEEKYELDIAGITNSVLYNLRNRHGYNPNASKQHIAATLLSGSRYSDLSKLNTPSLIIHGTTDPLIDFKHGEKCYEIIPNAQYLWAVASGRLG